MSFKGTRYSGWQRQRQGVSSVQEELEKALQRVTRHPISVMGCGRTDAGVHASSFYAHADFFDVPDIQKLNFALPGDIVVHHIIPVHDKAHSRFDAQSRSYTYLLHSNRNPFYEELSYYYPNPIKYPERMIGAADHVLIAKDFASFCKTPERHKTTFCTIQHCEWKFDFDTGKHSFKISANRFLKSMVRILVHDMLKVGEGKITNDEFQEWLTIKRPDQIHRIAYPQGLYLSGISYDYIPKDLLDSPLLV